MKLLLVIALVLQATFIYSATVQDGGVYKIKAKGTALFIGVQDDSNDFAAYFIATADHSSNHQRFEMHQVSANVYQIENLGSGSYFSNFVSPPVQANYNPTFYYQDYELIPAAGGYYMIRPVANTNAVLTVAQDGGLSWKTRTGADNQLFFFCGTTASRISTLKFAALRSTNLSAEEDDGNHEGIDYRPQEE